MVNTRPLLYYCAKDNHYYIKEETLCDDCKNALVEGDAFFIVSEYIKNLQRHKVLCIACTRKHKKVGDIAEFKQGFICRVTGLVTPVIFSKPELQSFKGDTVFDMAKSTKDKNVKVIDKTRYALMDDDSFIDKLIESTPKKKKLGYKKNKITR
jgi:hypothetical protein